MAADPLDLTTVAAVKAYGPFAGSVLDSLLQVLITSASRSFMTLTSRSDYVAAQFTAELRDGTGTDSMMLAHSPVTAMAQVKIGGVVVPPIMVTPATRFGYVVDLINGVVALVGGRFPRCRAGVQFDYYYGFAAVPQDVQHAVTELVVWLFNNRAHLDKKTETLAAMVTAYNLEYPQAVKDAIGYYSTKRRISTYAATPSTGPILTGGLQETTFVGTGASSVFTLPVVPTGALAWFRNGSLQISPDDYTQAGAVVTVALPAGSIVGDNFVAVYAL